MSPAAAAVSLRPKVALPALIALGGALLAAAPSLAVAQARQVASKTVGKVPVLPATLSEVRASLEKYHDPIVAVRDGFFSTVACIDFPNGAMHGDVHYRPGAMGVHFLNLNNIGPALDPAKPQILIYEPVGDKLRLVAAEWFVPAQLVKDGQAPRIFDQTLQGPMAGHEPVMPADLRHYDLHVWLWRENPLGVFESTNASVKCPKGGYSHQEGVAHKR